MNQVIAVHFLAFLLTIVSPHAALATTPNEPVSKLLSCWDGTYSYSRIAVSLAEGNPELLKVELSSQAQGFITELAHPPLARWGVAEVTFFIGKSQCQQDPNRPELMSCESHDGLLTAAYDETLQSRRILTYYIGLLKFRTSVTQDVFKVDLALTPFRSTAVSSVHVNFPLGGDGFCLNAGN
jgi:hypothetical protein